MKKIKRMAAFVLALTLIVGVVALPASASSHKGYSMSTSSKTSGPHKYMDNANVGYTLQYNCTLSGCRAGGSNDAATVKCFKDEWTYATQKPEDQTKFGNGSWSPWWTSCEKGDYNLELHAAASGRTLSTSGTFGNI